MLIERGVAGNLNTAKVRGCLDDLRRPLRGLRLAMDAGDDANVRT